MEIGSRQTFESFVVGPANRLASAAAARAAESPGTSYNPLFLYAASGLGKSHILAAIASQGEESHPNLAVKYQTTGTYLGELEAAVQLGIQDAFRVRYTDVGIFLLDDAQALEGHAEAQEMLLRVIDDLAGKGAQVVLASDRPPTKISGLDRRLLTRFSDGLIVDIGPPDYETRVAIVRSKMAERGGGLGHGVAEALGHLSISSVRQLERVVEQLAERQASDGRTLGPEDLPALLGEDVTAAATKAPGRASREETKPKAESPQSTARPDDVVEATKPGAELMFTEPVPSVTVEPPRPKSAAEMAVPDPVDPNWRDRIQEVADAANADSISPTQILSLLEASDPPDGWYWQLQHFQKQAGRVREVRRELDRLGNPWPETAAVLLTDPSRLEEAEGLLAAAHERARSFPTLPEGPGLSGLGGKFPSLAIKAAEQLIRGGPAEYNPLYVYSPDPEKVSLFLRAAGRSYLERNEAGTVAFGSIPGWAKEFGAAISAGVAGAWRERWWSADLVLLSEFEEVTKIERAKPELSHLFEALTHRGARILIGASRPPGPIEGLPEQMASRLAVGLAVDLGGEPPPAPPASKFVEVASEAPPVELWIPSPEKVVWDWPVPEDCLAEVDPASKPGG